MIKKGKMVTEMSSQVFKKSIFPIFKEMTAKTQCFLDIFKKSSKWLEKDQQALNHISSATLAEPKKTQKNVSVISVFRKKTEQPKLYRSFLSVIGGGGPWISCREFENFKKQWKMSFWIRENWRCSAEVLTNLSAEQPRIRNCPRWPTL